MRRTKIVCTLGPASSDERTIESLLKAGMNVARLNLSHGSHDEHRKCIETFRAVRDRLGLPAAVLLDTKGPEIRLGDFEKGRITVREGDAFILTTEKVLGDEAHAAVSYKDLPSQLSIGNTILIDDGRIVMEATGTSDVEIHCRVLRGGELSNHKGVNIPNVPLKMEYLSPVDRKDLLFGIEMDVDFIAASFARRADDVIAMRKFLDYNGGHSISIISKIENIEGVNNFDEILQHSNGIMVARGDMGVEVAYERLPGLQKRFIRRCYQSGKMVITATQMLESMITSPMPTRAEITDVANAVFDGTSAVMLSGETAIGRQPVLVVETMSRIVEQAEHDAFEMNAYRSFRYDENSATANAICEAACSTADEINAAVIIVVTKSGQSARGMSKFRPKKPIVAATPEEKTFHQLALSWGVYPVRARYQSTSDDLFLHAIDCARLVDLAKDGDVVVIAGGIPLNTCGTTNTLKVETVRTVYD